MTTAAATSRRPLVVHPDAPLLDPELHAYAVARAEARLGRSLSAGERRIDLVRLDRDLAAGKARLVAAIETERRSAASRYARDALAGREARLRLRLSPAIRSALRGLYAAGVAAGRGELARAGYDPDALPRALAAVPVRLAVIEDRIGGRLADLGVDSTHRLAIAVDLSSATRSSILKAVGALPGVRAIAADFTSVPAFAGLGSVWDEADAAGIVSSWTYTAVMDDGTCDVCAGYDGETYDSWEAIQDVLPDGGPNPDCDGGDRCRCRAVPEFGETADQGGVAPTGFVGPEAAPVDEITRDDLTGGLHSWIGSPQSMRIHMDALLNPEGASRYVDLPGSGKEFRREAQAVLDEIRTNGRLNDVKLYRGAGAPRIGEMPSSWTPDRAVAKRFAGPGGKIETLEPGEGFGIKVSDYISEGVADEQQWLIVDPKAEFLAGPKPPLPSWLGDASGDLRSLQDGYLTREQMQTKAAQEGDAAGFHPYYLPQEGYESGDWATPVMRDQHEKLLRIGDSIGREIDSRVFKVQTDAQARIDEIAAEREARMPEMIAADEARSQIIDDAYNELVAKFTAEGEMTDERWNELTNLLNSDPRVEAADRRLDDAREALFALTRERSEIEAGIADAKKQAYLDALSEIRDFGGSKWTIGRASLDAADLANEAARFYPTDWIDSTGPIDVHLSEERAFFRAADGSGLRGAYSYLQTHAGDVPTTIHELGHAQEMRAAILDAERVFYDYRTTVGPDGRTGAWVGDQQRVERMGGTYRDDEVTRPDDFFSRYCGKDYGGTNYELLTMGLQKLWSDPAALDAEYRSWLLGVLAALG